MADIFSSPMMAEGYALRRPPVHARILEPLRGQHFHRALDIGCGAGLSTRPLLNLAAHVVAFDINPAMARHTSSHDILSAVGSVEYLPFAPTSFDLITAAGALNWSDPDETLPEIARVLHSDGSFFLYDFGPGQRFPGDDRLGEWFSRFAARWPFPPARAVDPDLLPLAVHGLHLISNEAFALPVSMSAGFYRDYMMTETNVAEAIAQGTAEAAIRSWIDEGIAPLFAGATNEVLIEGYRAIIRKA